MRENPIEVAERRLLGVGVSFPLRQNASGYISMSFGRQLVKESIEQLIMTDPMERPCLLRNGYTYGTRIKRMLFESIDSARSIAIADVKQAIAIWEPRVVLFDNGVTVDEMRGSDDGSGKGASLVISVRYKIKATGFPDFHVVNVSKEGRP